MGIKKYLFNFSDFSSESTLRFDLNYLVESSKDYDYYKFNELFDVINPEKLEIPTDDFYYAEIGDVSSFGDINPTLLSVCERTEDKEPLFKKIEKGDIIFPQKNDILLSKIRPYLKKNVLVGDENHIYYTKAFIQIRSKKFNPKIAYYLFQSKFFNKLNSISRRGKGYPTLSPLDFNSLKFEKKDIYLIGLNEKSILKSISFIESQINNLKSTRLQDFDIINKILGEELGIDWKALVKIDQTKKFISSFSDLSTKNDNLRFGYRWNRAVEIQGELNNQFKKCIKLGYHILETQNGYSPSCGEDGDYKVLGIDSISKSTVLSFDNLKYSSDIINLEKFVIHNGEFFVSRGNTVELVALASIADVLDEQAVTIFPDLMIRIKFDNEIDTHYMAYVFNSFIGRLYFKNVTKGKNQTMVKVSEHELRNFIVPLPPKEKQVQIAAKIKDQLDAQKKIDDQIRQKQQEILQIVENALKNK